MGVLVEAVDLDLANAGLGGLDEVALLRLFANTQAHALVRGTGRTLREIENADGTPLYPAFYRTRVHVPAPVVLGSHRTWDRIDVGVDVRRFGAMILESRGCVAKAGALSSDSSAWPSEQVVRVEGSLAFIHDTPSGGDFRVDAPRAGTIADLPPLAERPSALDAQRRVRREGVLGAKRGKISDRVQTRLFLGRDLQAGRAAMFSTFTLLLEVSEQTLLLERIVPAIDPELLSYVQLLEREVFYLGNVRQGEEVAVDLSIEASPCEAGLAAAYPGSVGVMSLEVRGEIYEAKRNALLATSHAKKVAVVPRARAAAIQDLQRFLARHGGP